VSPFSGLADEETGAWWQAARPAAVGWLAGEVVVGRAHGFHTAPPLQQMAAVAPAEEPKPQPLVVLLPEVRARNIKSLALPKVMFESRAPCWVG
jgi:hypothetical protein